MLRAGVIYAHTPSASLLAPDAPIQLGIQRGAAVEQVVTVTGADESFTFDAELHDGPDLPDARGQHVFGRRGDRFLYLSWGAADNDGEFAMFARAKLLFRDLGIDQWAELMADPRIGLSIEVDLVTHQGQPATGSIRPPALKWIVVPPID